jgi:predicted CopG family antitoxin
MPTQMKNVTIYIPQSLYDRLKSLAAGEARSMSQYVSRLLERKLPPPKVEARP